MMVYTLWGEPDSGSFMIEAALAEAGQAVDLIDIDLTKDEQHGETYLAVNPTGKIPALRLPDGSVMTQSAAILITLDEHHPKARLLPPPGAPDRSHALSWLTFLVAEIYPLVEMFDYPARFVPPETVETGVRSRIRVLMRERWRLVEAAAASEGSFLLAGFSAIDLAITIMSHWDIGAEWRARECPKIERIARTVIARNCSGTVWRRHFPIAADTPAK